MTSAAFVYTPESVDYGDRNRRTMTRPVVIDADSLRAPDGQPTTSEAIVAMTFDWISRGHKTTVLLARDHDPDDDCLRKMKELGVAKEFDHREFAALLFRKSYGNPIVITSKRRAMDVWDGDKRNVPSNDFVLFARRLRGRAHRFSYTPVVLGGRRSKYLNEIDLCLASNTSTYAPALRTEQLTLQQQLVLCDVLGAAMTVDLSASSLDVVQSLLEYANSKN